MSEIFYTHSRIDANDDRTNGTHLQGYINANYDYLVLQFGEPDENNFDDYKIDAHWAIRFSDGEVATIYNWKNGVNYLGEDGEDVKDIVEWHIGGINPDVVERVKLIMSLGERSENLRTDV